LPAINEPPAGSTLGASEARAGTTTDAEMSRPSSSDGERPNLRKSRGRGAARLLIIAAVTRLHEYANGGCGNFRPLGVRELADAADVSPDSVSEFFKKEFGDEDGHARYQRFCITDSGRIVRWLKSLNEDYRTNPLFETDDFSVHGSDDE